MTFAAASLEAQREFPFTVEDFGFLARLVYENSGIVLSEHKANMVYSRLARRLRELRLDSFQAYCARLRGPSGEEELGALINAITTNLTRFFRERHHFEHLAREVLPAFAAAPKGTRLRLWSAGCSSGEEPYSIAMTMNECLPNLPRLDARILATDLDTAMVAKARAAVYPAASLEDIDGERRERWFSPLANRAGWSVDAALRARITFKTLNLLAPWPMQGRFDAIFCRNVMIYFDALTKDELIERFADCLNPGGWLYVGHSETLLDQRRVFVPVGRTIYRKAGP